MSRSSIISTKYELVSRQAGQGAIWIFGTSIIQNAIRLISSAILARLLEPEAFGLFGIAYLSYDLILRFSLSGMAGGVIAKSNLNQEDLSTCFWALSVLGLLIVTVAYIITPLISLWFGDLRATGILRLVLIVVFISCVTGVHNALLRRKLQFRTIAIIRTLSVTLESISAVFFAFLGLNYWALAIGMVTGVFFQSTCTVLMVRWIPRWQFNKQKFFYFWRFGINGIYSSILGYLSANIDYWLTAKLVGIKALGYYEFAYRLPHIIVERFAGPAGSVMFPAMAAIRNDKPRIFEWYVKATKIIAMFVFPCLGGLNVLARPIVQVLWGNKWLSIVPLLQILCIGAAMGSFWFLHRAVYLSQDRPDLPVKMGILSLIFSAVLVTYGGWNFGLKGVAVGITLSRVVELAWVWQALRLINGSMAIWINSLLAPIIGTLMMTSVLHFISYLAREELLLPVVQILLFIPLGIFVYTMSIKLLFSKEYDEFFEMLKTVFVKL